MQLVHSVVVAFVMFVVTAIVSEDCKRQEVYYALSLTLILLLQRASHFLLSSTNTIILRLPTKTL